jgi:hypothetical protein
MPIGFSYAPGSDIPYNGEGGGGQSPSRLSPQQAVKILSLRVPESLPSNAPVARSLLTSPGGSAAGASGLQSMIQQLIQGFRPMQGGGLPSSPMQMPPMQAPMTGPNQNVSQQPQFTGNMDVPTDPMLNPFLGGTGVGGFAGGGSGGNFGGSDWERAVQQWANQTMQSSPLTPHFDIGQNGPFVQAGNYNT